ncbi:uncharacterized protein LOC143702998 isoform X2 [Siphateles boraxobius]
MNQTEDMQNDQSEIIVKTEKEVCAEGLVVSGGGKDGIFIKEVKAESPASKNLSVKEGDQILSATVYFDNVSYEDALQILEHAQPYKVAFCLKRKPPPRTQEDAETMRPDITIGEEAEQEEEGGGPEMRGRRKIKKQHDRISWPKFPTFSKGRRANFKRSHSTSEAEEQRKLEISPPTSDTESPIKSPLKSPDEKEKKKTHKMKLKMRMADCRSKSVEETKENEEVPTTDNMVVLDNQIIMNIAVEQVPGTNVLESPKILNLAENTDSTKTRNEYTFPTLPATESLHKVERISLDTTSKTTDITVALGEDDKERRESSKLKVSIPGKDKYETETESQLKSSISGMRTSDTSAFDNIMDSPNVISQIEAVGHKVDTESKPINKEIVEKTQKSGEMDIDMDITKVDVPLDMPDVGPISKSPRIGSDKEKKERNILETESYGIRTRGPMADIAALKSPFANTVNRLEFTPSDTFTFDIQTKQDVSSTVMDTKKPITSTPVISQPKSHALEVDKSGKSTKVADTEVTKKANLESNFKLPKIDLSEFNHEDSITIRQRDPNKVPLLKREEIEIPGMEDKGSKTKFKSPRIKEQKIEKIINISKAEKPQAVFNVEDVKEAVSKFPAFKLPERDITGVLVQREITIKSDKTGMTPKGSPSKLSSMSTEINIKLPDTMDKEEQRLSPVASKDQGILLPKTEQFHLYETSVTESKSDQTKIKPADHKPKSGKMLVRDTRGTSPDVKFKLPKREDIEIPGMEAIEQSVNLLKIKLAKDTDTQDEAVKDYTDTDIKADRKGHEKKSKKGKISIPSFGIKTPDIHFPGIAIELPKKDTSSKSDCDVIKEMKTEAKISIDEDHVAIKKSSEEATFEKSQKGESCAPEHEIKKAHGIEGDQMLHHDVSTDIKETSKQDVEGELKAEIKSKDTDSSPHKKKMPKFKMPKIGGKSLKGTTEVTTKEDATVEEDYIIEIALNSEKRTSETDPKAYSSETDKNLNKFKTPSIDVSVPKIKIPKTEGKSKQEETGLSTPERLGKVDKKVEAAEDTQEESGFRLINFGVSLPKEKTEEAGLLPEESKKSIKKVSGKTEVEPSELPQAEIKETESKMKKRKISFPKFGFSKSETKVSDTDITLPTTQGSLQGADEIELKVESKTTDVEAEFKDSTDSHTKFRLPTIKLPKFGVSFPKTIDAGADIQMPKVSTDETTKDVKLPEAKLSVESTALSNKKGLEMTLSVSKPEVDLSLPDGKTEIKGICVPKVDDFQKKEIKSSKDISFSKPEVNVSIVGHGLDQEATIEDLKVQAEKLEMEVKVPSGTVDVVIPEAKEKEKLKKHKISFPKFGFSRSDTKIPDANTSLQKEGVSEPDTEIKETEVTIPAPEVEVQLKNKSASGSPSKFKLPTISLPKYDISISKTGEESIIAKAGDDTQSEIKATSTVTSQDKDMEPSKSIFETLPVDAEIKIQDTDPGGQGSRFMMPKFEFSFPKLKGPEFKKGASKTDVEKPDATLKHDIESAEGKADIPEASLKMEVTMKRPKEPSSESSKQDIKGPEINVERVDTSMAVGEVDVNLETDLKDDSTTGGSPFKFKLPSFKLPKFGSSSSKVKSEITDLRGEEITLEAEDIFTSVEASDVKIDFNVPSQELKKPSISVDQPKLDTGDQCTLSLTEAITSKAEVDISLPETKLGELSAGAEVPKAKTESKKDQEVDLKDPAIKMKRTGFSFPKFGFSKPDIKTPETDVNLAQVDTSEPEGDVKIKEQSMNITVLNYEAQQKDTTTFGATTTFKLPSINFPKIGGQAMKEEKTMPDVDIVVKEPEMSGPYTQIKIAGEAPSADIKGPHLVTEGQSVSVDLNIEDAELGGQWGELNMPKFGIDLPKVKGFDLSASKTEDIAELQEIILKKTEITTEGKIHPPEHDFKGLDVQIKTLPKFGVSKAEIKAPEVDVSIQKTDIPISEGSIGLEEANMDIEVSVEPDQKGSTFFGSPTKFKLPSFSFPKFGVKSQKGALDINVTDSELEGTNIKSDISKPDVKQEVQPPKNESEVEKSADMPEVDSKGLQVKAKRPSFSFPKFGFSKPNTATPEVDVSVEKAEVSIPESNVPVKEQTAEVTFPVREAEQKDLTIVSSPTKYKMPEVNLPKFGVKSSKGTASLPSADKDIKGIEITTIRNEPDINVSGKIPKIERVPDTRATIRETDVHLAEGKVILPQPNVDVQDISIEGEADIPEVDLKGLDVKLKKSSFSLPKFGFSKPDIKGHDVDQASQPKANMSMQEGTIPVKDQDAEITFTDKMKKQEDPTHTKSNLPSINLPKFGIKYPKSTSDIQAAEVDIKKPEISFSETIEVQTTNTETNVDIKGPTVNVDIKVKEMDIDGTGSMFKLPAFGIGMPKVKEIETEGKEINTELGLLCEEKVNVQQPDFAIQNVTIEGETDKVEVDSKGLKVKFPKLGFSKQDLKAPEVDVSLHKPDMGTSQGNVDFSEQSVDIILTEEQPDLKKDTFSSPTRFRLPTINFPKFGAKTSKDTVDIPMANVDISEVSLPDKTFNMSGEVASVDMKEPTVNFEDPSIEMNIKSKFKLPKFGIALPTTKGPDSDQGLKKDLTKTEVKISGDVLTTDEKELKLPKGIVEVDMQASEMTTDISLQGTAEMGESERDGKTEITSPQFGSPTKFKLPEIKLPKFGFSAPKVSSAALDSDIKEIKVSSVDQSDDIKCKSAETETPSIDMTIKAKEIDQEGPETKFKLPKFGISLPKVKGPEVIVTAKEVKKGTPEIGITEPKIKIAADDASLPKVAMALEGSSSLEKTEVETELKDDTIVVSGSPSKFKMPAFKMPRFGMSTKKTSDAKGKEAEVDVPDTKTDLNIKDKPLQVEVSKDIHREGEIKETTEQPPEVVEKKMEDDKGSPSKFKLATMKMPKFSISRTKSQDGEDDTTINANAPDTKTQPKDDSQGPGKSPRFTMPRLEDVLSGFEVEFNVPTIEEMEEQMDKPAVKQDQEAGEKVEEVAEHQGKGAQEKSKFKFKFPKLGFSQSSDESDKLVDAKTEESEKHLEASADQKSAVSKEQAKTEKGGWFKFSFSSPTKTTKSDEKEQIIQPPEEAEKSDDVEKESSKAHEEPEKSLFSEAVEDNISPTLSLRSSEAFADISSTVTTEPVGLSQTSPTKVKVKYAEPTATIGVKDVQTNVVTSTARCELVSMEPHQPEKVNIPFSSDMSSASVDTLKQMSGEIHVITSNIQAIPDTQQAAIFTNLDHGIHTSPLQVTLGSDSVLTVEETRVQTGKQTLMEKHVVKETLHDDKETIIVTQRTRVFEGDSAEPISDDTASSIRRLRDTVHTEKMRFFDSVAEEVTIVSYETSLRHMDSSTDENEGK